ncbi:hypothetical protein TNCV_5129021 [Trichonephila clavipes]|nr:hypothetical protein TNCV_5129021 [Trichonephila clavipes]
MLPWDLRHLVCLALKEYYVPSCVGTTLEKAYTSITMSSATICTRTRIRQKPSSRMYCPALYWTQGWRYGLEANESNEQWNLLEVMGILSSGKLEARQ